VSEQKPIETDSAEHCCSRVRLIGGSANFELGFSRYGDHRRTLALRLERVGDHRIARKHHHASEALPPLAGMTKHAGQRDIPM
jgi:hypothetical protein